METMRKLAERFGKIHPGYSAELDEIDSYKGWYLVDITDETFGITSRIDFTSARDFREWMNGVVLD